MKRLCLLLMLAMFIISAFPGSVSSDLPKIAIWDLEERNIPASYAKELTSILGSEVSKLKKYEVYSQDSLRKFIGWSEEKMRLGCNDDKCLIALGQMEISKLISGSVGKVGNRYSVSLTLFDNQKVRTENVISEFCRSEDELIELVQQAVLKLLGVIEVVSSPPTSPTPVQPARSEPRQGETYKDPVTGMEFVFVKGGCFEMGDTFGDGDVNERPSHEVCLNGFWVGKFEVTQGQWERVMRNNPSNFKKGDNYPVEQVSWNDVQEFIQRLSQSSGKRFRLPTEVEWEYAARSGGKREKWAGTNNESDLGSYAWYISNSGSSTHPVGQKRPNALGLYDMSGNVWEWCQDWYDKDYYSRRVRDNPKGPDNGQGRVLRGGSWSGGPRCARASYRIWVAPADRDGGSGFRLVLPSD